MIDVTSIRAWNESFPWKDKAMVEQDLIISRALVAIFSDEYLASQLAFRGGTALHKLYLSPQPRYSEDIDLVQINAGPIKPIMYRLGEVLDFLPNRITKQKRYNNTMLFRMESEIPPVVPIRLKIEINCFEHFNDLVKLPFKVENPWFSGKCDITTYKLNELLGTKLRALYQRRKGRDLFDLYVAMSHPDINVDEILRCYHRYIGFSVAQPPTKKQFILNLEEKLQDPEFVGDINLLLRPDISFDSPTGFNAISQIVQKL